MVLEWVAVQDAFPQDMEDVIIFDEVEGEYIGYYFSPRRMFIRYADGLTFEHVTRWKPLPVRQKSSQITLKSLSR